jgi:FkbM family methyltransferase
MPSPQGVTRKLRRLLQREDLRQNPARAVYRRLAWRIRWRISSEPWLVRRQNGLPLLLPHGGAAALIYLQGSSEPELTSFLRSFLKEGMVFVDVGAHLGEHTVLAASIVKDSGAVHAFEARPDTFEILTRNVAMNGFRNVVAKPWAVWNQNGPCDIEQTSDPSVSVLRPNEKRRSGGPQLLTVNAVSLDSYFEQSGAQKPALIKIDVEGAELQVLQGATGLLSSFEPPAVVVEYGPVNTAAFGYAADEVCTFLRDLGYRINQLTDKGMIPVPGKPTLGATADTCNLVASKDAMAALLPATA